MIPAAPLQSLHPPWVHLLIEEDGEFVEGVPVDLPGFQIVTLEGLRCETKHSLLSEYTRMFGFPSYFGGNWDAFEECLSDLEWIPATGYLTLIKNGERVLCHQEDEYVTLIDILQNIGRGWSLPHPETLQQPPRPFHTLLLVNRDHYRDRQDWKLPMLFPPTP